MLFDSNVAVWVWRAVGSALVAVQVVEPFHSSAVASDAVPFDPPATSTWPFFTMVDGSNVAVCACRAVVMLPADAQLPEPLAALNSDVVFKTVVPFKPPVTSTLPFASAVAVCASRALDSAVRLLQADVPSKSCTFATVAPPPESPPTTRTLLFSVALPET